MPRIPFDSSPGLLALVTTDPAVLLLLLLAAGVAAAAAWVVARLLVARSIHAMLRVVERIAEGDFAARSGLPPARGELGLLAHGLDDMAAHLERRDREAKDAEERLLHVQKMDAIGRLAAGVAHDFNNLLTVINGVTDLAIRRLPAGDPLRQDLAQVQAAGERATDLTRRLLTVGRRQESVPTLLSPNEVVSGFESMLRRMIGEDIALSVRLGERVGAVKADPGQLEQVLMNLAVNARDAMPRGGSLTIETAETQLDEALGRQAGGAAPGRYAVVSVSDTGQGMDAETRRRCFEPFFTTKPIGKGTGLGLSTVYGIVKQHGGHVWLYSEMGQGTTFRVYLPVVEAEAPVEKTRPVAGAPRGSETVLIAEDEEFVRDLLRTLLEDLGYKVLAAEEASGALRALQAADRVDLLLTDLVMPGPSGRDLATQALALRPALRVIFMSGYPEEEATRGAPPPAGAGFLQKPFTQETLARAVRSILGGPAEAASGGPTQAASGGPTASA